MKISEKKKHPSRFSRRQRIRNRKLYPIIMKNLMKRKPTSLRSSRKDQGSTKENYLSNVLIVESLGILHPSVPIPRKNMKMKETQINHLRKRKNPIRRKAIIKGRRTFTQKKKTTVQMSLVIVMKMKSSFQALKRLMREKKLSMKKNQKLKQRSIWKQNFLVP